MAERRTTNLHDATAFAEVAWLFEAAGLPSAWFVKEADASVIQPFYAALDSAQRICWTDDPNRAQRFDTKQAAERFAVDRLTTAVSIVPGP